MAWVFLRAELRRRWRAWLSVALLAAAFAGVTTAAAAGARRTDSAYPRLLAWSKAPHMLIVSGYSPSLAPLPRAALPRMPQVTAVGYVREIGLVAPHDINLLAPEDNQIPGSLWKRKIVAGRLADPARSDEVNVSFMVAQARHLRPGDTLRVVLETARGKPVPFAFRVAGIEAAAAEFPPQTDTGPGHVWATLAFWRTHRTEVFETFPQAVLRLRHGSADVTAVQRELTRLAHGKIPGVGDPLAAQLANTEHSIHLQAVALWLLAGILGAIGVLVLGQILARLSFTESSDYAALRALGTSRRQLMAIGVGRAAAIGTAAAGLTVALAFALSPLLPVGLAGVAEPHPGLDADGWVLAIGGLAAVLVTVACAAPSAWRAAASDFAPGVVPVLPARSRPIIALARSIGSAPQMMGIRLALQPGAGRTALPVRSTIAGAVIGVAALSAAMVFSASLGHLLATPRLYGVTWDANVGSPIGAELTPVATIVAHDPDVAAWSVGNSNAPVRVNGISVGGIAMNSGRGPSLMAAPVEGRLPRGPGEITLGTRTLAVTHTHVGGTVPVSYLSQGPVRFRIVGTAIFPALSDGLGLGQGAAFTVSGARQVPGVPAVPLYTLLVRFRPGADPRTAMGTLTSRVTRAGPFAVQGPPTPTDLVNFGRVRNLPMLLGIALSGLALLTIAHLLITSVRRRHRDFAILRALGFTRGQVRRTAAWQAATLTAAALAIGIPAGAVCGRAAWLIFARHLGIVPAPDIPLPWFAVLIPIALGLAVA
ncbi:MAG TPA: FtsX-like permease family protein, partial [Streptosporangiaceae bacterium]|nr:FtsX-like permease family protein [Streptosporangiaceae bacterium]